MDLVDFRSILRNSGVDIWTFIETAITVASLDNGSELKDRRDRIIGKLYADVAPVCRHCDIDPLMSNGIKTKPVVESEKERESSHEHESKNDSPMTPVFVHEDVDNDELDGRFNHEADDEQRRILAIKERIEDPQQSEASLIDLLQSLADMDITFKALKETDIGRHVNRFRKHPSSDVRKLVKQLVRKWKDLVDEWVRLNTPGESQSSARLADGDSPQQTVPKNQQNGYQQVSDFACSPPNPHRLSGPSEPEQKPTPKTAPQREPPTKPAQNALLSSSDPPLKRHREPDIDPERLASARRRLHENYQEAENARKQRTIQVMDIHEIPKPKNARNKGIFHGRR
ncbi:hypothetical protein Nepgr_008509 [Nepenthes gracilis]|uniref:TFIIS N-terminal domain-containing protein n=1 Tax=Nepenthes gracilis TaxID=150966 RepID=A0AAD3S9E7_NEPGR|nr:hypothetical protein Nepgr_008509 [Nepenthes gracilis]